MCGVGLLKFYKEKPSKSFLLECGNIISSEQSSRGPDNSAKWISEDCMTMICHQRLAILDLSKSSNQPFENDDYVGSFNGEVYNYPELSKDKGRIFKSDTLYLKNTIKKNNLSKLLPNFEGPFALILYNKKNKEVTIARDSYGEKPLYYFKNENYFIVASKVKSIILIIQKLKEKYLYNKKNIQRNLVYGFDVNNSTPIKDIKSLNKGTYAIDNPFKSTLKLNSYTKKTKNLTTIIKKNNFINLFKDYFEESVDQKLRSDVPIGIFLSGGLDSSLVTTVAKKLCPNQIRTYTIDFSSNGNFHFDRAKIITQELKIHNKQILFTPKKALDSIKILSDCLTSLNSDPAQLPLLLLSKYASKNTPVVLSGDGADELFYGYSRYQRFKLINIMRILKFNKLITCIEFFKGDKRLSRYKKSLNSNAKNISYLNLFNFWQCPEPIFQNESYLYQNELNNIKKNEDPCLIDQEFYLPEVILRKSDSCTMQFGIEARLPFISNKLISLSHNIRTNFPKLRKKDIFLPLIKYYLGGQIYSKFINLPKKGLTVPLSQIFQDNSIQNYMDGYFNSDVLAKFDFLDSEKILQLWENIKNNNEVHNPYGMWALFTFLHWSNNLEL